MRRVTRSDVYKTGYKCSCGVRIRGRWGYFLHWLRWGEHSD